MGGDMKRIVMLIVLAIVAGSCSEPLTTREKGAGIGTFAGAGLGAIIGSATGNAGAGAGIGAAVGLLGGALIGDQVQARDKQEAETQRQIQAQQAEIDRQRRELEQLKQAR
jgi:outer membrane lipoprotein SlyB